MKKIIALLSVAMLGVSILLSVASCQVYEQDDASTVLINYKGDRASDENEDGEINNDPENTPDDFTDDIEETLDNYDDYANYQ